MSIWSDGSDLSGRVAVVTGGAGHVGRVVGDTLASMGATVCAMDLEAARPGAQQAFEAVDLRDESQVREAVHRVNRRFGGFDILVHAAAFVGTTQYAGWAVPFADQSVDAWDSALRVNVTSAFVLVQEAREALRRSGRGCVVLISSIYGMLGPDWSLYEGTMMANPTAYGVSKGGLLQLMRYLTTTMAPDVRVNAVSVGGVERGQPESFRARYEARTPLRRMATEGDVATAVAFLVSDLSAYVTGHNLVVDGGWTAW